MSKLLPEGLTRRKRPRDAKQPSTKAQQAVAESTVKRPKQEPQASASSQATGAPAAAAGTVGGSGSGISPTPSLVGGNVTAAVTAVNVPPDIPTVTAPRRRNDGGRMRQGAGSRPPSKHVDDFDKGPGGFGLGGVDGCPCPGQGVSRWAVRACRHSPGIWGLDY